MTQGATFCNKPRATVFRVTLERIEVVLAPVRIVGGNDVRIDPLAVKCGSHLLANGSQALITPRFSRSHMSPFRHPAVHLACKREPWIMATLYETCEVNQALLRKRRVVRVRGAHACASTVLSAFDSKRSPVSCTQQALPCPLKKPTSKLPQNCLPQCFVREGISGMRVRFVSSK
eukprot:47405-Prorocentrum_minimum.AAC.3